MNEKRLCRILDANFNRAKEGLRVCEDICRFILDRKALTQSFKEVRHDLTQAMSCWGIREFIRARDIEGDVGKKTTAGELKRSEAEDIFLANIQRAKESVRVLEEFAKLKNIPAARRLKNLRYRLYALEKKVVA